MHFTDEQLNQLIDGELSPDEENALRLALSQDDLLAERYAALAIADVRFKESFNSIDDAPIPESILLLLTDDPVHNRQVGSSREADNSRSFWQRLGGVMAKPVSLPPTAAMAFTFLLFGVITLYVWQPIKQNPQLAAADPLQAVHYGVLDRANPVSRILSNAPSGSAPKILEGSDIAVVPVLSFASNTGDFCREYTLTSASSSHRAVACNQEEGWRVVLSTRAEELQSPDKYQTASAIAESEFEKKINEIIHGDPLSFKQELLLIERAWSSADESSE